MAEETTVLHAADIIRLEQEAEGQKADEAHRRVCQAMHNVFFAGQSNAKDRAIVMTWMLNEGNVFTSYGQHNASAYAMEGKREFALKILGYLGFGNDIRSLLKALQAIQAADKEITIITTKGE